LRAGVGFEREGAWCRLRRDGRRAEPSQIDVVWSRRQDGAERRWIAL
jgi:hypothetical protein